MSRMQASSIPLYSISILHSNQKKSSLIPSGRGKEKSKYVDCPCCKIKIEYVGGGKFIECTSVICKKSKEKVYFCLICLSKLELKNKDKHFPNGIYTSTCMGKKT